MAALLGTIVFVIGLFSFFIYFIYIRTLYKYRKKEPFNWSFFTLLFHIGIFDMLMMTERQLLWRFPRYGWLGMNKLVMMAPHFFAKLHTILFWYLVKPQVLGTLLLTINRFGAIVYNHKWTPKQTRNFVIAVWLMPMPFNIPLWFQDFYYVNTTGGGALILYQNTNFQFYYMAVCFIQCILLVLAGVICYGIIFAVTWRAHKNQRVRSEKGKKAEFNILFIGVVLTLLTFECAIACGWMAYGTDRETLLAALPWFDVGTELYCWINPYCLLITSSAMRKHFWATLTSTNVNTVSPASNKAKTERNKRNNIVVQPVVSVEMHEICPVD